MKPAKSLKKAMVKSQEATETAIDHQTRENIQKMGDGFRDEYEPNQRCAPKRRAVYWKNSLTICCGSDRGVMGGAQGERRNLLEAHNVISFNTEIKRNKVAKSSTINAETSNAETSKDAP